MLARLDHRLAIAGATLLAAAGLGVATLGGTAAGARGFPDPPNVILVMTDDQALSQMNREALPRVTKLIGNRGTKFDNAFLTTPLCCPSRATFLTGQYGHNNGVLRNSYPSLRGKGNVLPVWLHRAGYVTAHVGKFLNRYHHRRRQTAVAPGWDEWYTQLDTSEDTYYDWHLSANGRRIHYGHRDSDYAPRVFGRRAQRLVRRYVPKRKPLFLELDEIAPHPGPGGAGTRCRGNPVPDPRDANLFRNEPLPQPASFNESDVSDKPSFVRSLPLLDQDRIDAITRRFRCGLASLRAVDRTVGRLHREIAELGELGNTVFVFYTDNGVFFGQHRVAGGKLYPYEEADRTPLLIRLPARYRNGHSRVPHVPQPVANIDFAPTILRLAHAQPCRGGGICRVMDGRSLLPLLRGRKPAWAAERPLGIELGLMNANSSHAVCRYAGVRLPDAVLVRHTKIADPDTGSCVKGVERERYDLQDDPSELHNICFGGGACPSDSRQEQLKRLLARIHQCSGVRGRDPRPPSGKYCG